jgi:hypothetical protein
VGNKAGLNDMKNWNARVRLSVSTVGIPRDIVFKAAALMDTTNEPTVEIPVTEY